MTYKEYAASAPVSGKNNQWDAFQEGWQGSFDSSKLNSEHAKQLDSMKLDYANSQNAYESMKKAEIDALSRSRDYSQGLLNDINSRSQREAYIQSEQSKKSLPLLLNAQGYSGGMSESAASDLQRSYENARIKNDGELSRQTGALGENYNNNLTEKNKYYGEKMIGLLGEYNNNKMNATNDYNDKSYNRAWSSFQAEVDEKRNEEQKAMQEKQMRQDQVQYELDLAFRQNQAQEDARRWQAQWDQSQAAAAAAAAASASSGGGKSKKKNNPSPPPAVKPKHAIYGDIYGH